MLFVIRHLYRIFWKNNDKPFLVLRYPISTKPSTKYENVVPTWSTWVSWAIPAAPISWPIRHPPMKTITSVIGYTPFTFYLRVFAFWTREVSRNRSDWMLRLAADIPKRSSSSRNWFASPYPVRPMPTMSSTTYISTSITRPCRTRRAILKTTEAHMANASIDTPAKIPRATDSSQTTIFNIKKSSVLSVILKYHFSSQVRLILMRTSVKRLDVNKVCR